MQALTFELQSTAFTCAAEPAMTAKASRVRSIILFMYVSSLRVGRRIFNLVQYLAAGPVFGRVKARSYCPRGQYRTHLGRGAGLTLKTAIRRFGGVSYALLRSRQVKCGCNLETSRRRTMIHTIFWFTGMLTWLLIASAGAMFLIADLHDRYVMRRPRNG
jgi:hypothetical protein